MGIVGIRLLSVSTPPPPITHGPINCKNYSNLDLFKKLKHDEKSNLSWRMLYATGLNSTCSQSRRQLKSSWCWGTRRRSLILYIRTWSPLVRRTPAYSLVEVCTLPVHSMQSCYLFRSEHGGLLGSGACCGIWEYSAVCCIGL